MITHHSRKVHELSENNVSLLLIHQLLRQSLPHCHISRAICLPTGISCLHSIVTSMSQQC